MSNEYRLSYTASEIDEKLRKIDDLATKQQVELDTTLTQSGKAADAKAVGDRLTVLESATSSGSGGISILAANLLLTILRNGVYTSDQSANIAALEAELAAGGDVPDLPEADVSQTGSILSIVSGVTASQSGSVLVIS